ncbi:hypothetical protein L1987_01740 [Smallanthus sonchifolius]|uniref:Uncharacterized protein n=1 Tax=Smallanthus sonchifolius TaxID=185202 RepID=A0ACB9K620_9ASTR|nr:hypothetical protein L1987_01740 [Smallanthus sonchifolius]
MRILKKKSNSRENDDEQVEYKEVLLIECEPKPEFKTKKDEIVPSFIPDTNDIDLLGLNQTNPKALELDQNDAMALGTVQNGNNPQSSFTDLNGSKTTPGWELALVEKNSNLSNNKPQSKSGGGLDKFLLDSLYEDEIARRQIKLRNAGYNKSYKRDMQYNPFDQQPPPLTLHDRLMMSSRVAPPMNVPMAMLQQQLPSFLSATM